MPTASDRVTLAVRVVPRASRRSLRVEPDGSLRARLHAPPVEGAANEELTAMLAEAFEVSRGAVTIVGGAHSRAKRVEISGIDARRAAAVLAGLGPT